MSRQNPTQKRLLELYDYNPDTGDLIFRPRPPEAFASHRAFLSFNGKCLGKVAGAVNGFGYYSVRVDGAQFLAHRMIWIMVHGSIPELEIDHINGVRHDNRIANLRLANKMKNAHNQSLRSTNKSGVNGVRYSESRKKWRAEAHNGDRHIIMEFKTMEEAIACRRGIDRAWEFDEGHGKPRQAEFYAPTGSLALGTDPSPEAGPEHSQEQ